MSNFASSLGFKSQQEQETTVKQFLVENGFKDETFNGFANCTVMPSLWYYAIFAPLLAILMKFKMLILTDKHLFVVDLDMKNKFQSFTPYTFPEVTLLRSKMGLLGSTKLTLEFPDKSIMEFDVAAPRGGKEFAEKIVSLLQIPIVK